MADSIIIGHDNISLAYFEKHNPSAQVGILLLHGLAEHKGRYVELFEKLFEREVSVFAFDLRGHGASLGKRGDVKDYSLFVADVHCVVRRIKEQYPHLKLAILGHSLGGQIAAAYSAIYDTTDYLVLSNPLLIPPRKSKIFRFIPYKALGFLKLKKRHSESPEMLAYSYSDPLASNYFTVRLLGTIFHQGMMRINDTLKDVTQPMLILTGELDPLIDSSALQKVLGRFGSSDKQVRTYKNVKHRLFQSEQKDMVIDEMVTWLNERL